ncbi:MAG TPA: SDR family NAD(P)-dependent oxidoreductase [Solirubrobacteraceae bacterium]|jgi:NAD(P)-dependent dehydrogenase (short-subunit alcohol dehydrogenase family)
MRDFGGKVAVITGAGSGIGRALALELAARGARLAISDVNTANVAETARQGSARGAEVEHYELDVSSRDAVFAHADEVVARFGGVNLIFNNAGVAMHQAIIDTPIEDFEWLMGINYWGVVYGTKAFLPHLVASGDGYVVNISSVFGIISVPGQSAYNSAKFAVRGFTEALREEMLSAGLPVGVSCVHPGGVKTSIASSAKTPGRDTKEAADQFEKMARLTPAKAAQIIIRGVEREQARILVGADAKFIDAMQRVLGARYQEIVYRAAKRSEPPAVSPAQVPSQAPAAGQVSAGASGSAATAASNSDSENSGSSSVPARNAS